MSILLYKCTTWKLSKCIEKKRDNSCTSMLWTILNKSWKQHPTKQQLYGHLLPISKTIQIRWTRHVGHCWRSKDKHINDVLLWIPSHGCISVGQPGWTYLQQLCADTGCSLEDLPEVVDDRDRWWDKFREVHAYSLTWWWWWCPFIYLLNSLHFFFRWADKYKLPKF